MPIWTIKTLNDEVDKRGVFWRVQQLIPVGQAGWMCLDERAVLGCNGVVLGILRPSAALAPDKFRRLHVIRRYKGEKCRRASD